MIKLLLMSSGLFFWVSIIYFIYAKKIKNRTSKTADIIEKLEHLCFLIFQLKPDKRREMYKYLAVSIKILGKAYIKVTGDELPDDYKIFIYE